MDFSFGLEFFAALFAIMNPLTTIPVFLGLAATQDEVSRRRMLPAMLTTVSIGSILTAIAGRYVLAAFGIDITHFRLAGGLVVLLIGLTLLTGTEHPSQDPSQEKAKAAPKESRAFAAVVSTGVYPLGIPITLGPGTMATLIIFAQTSIDRSVVPSYAVTLVAYLAFFSVFMILAPLIGRVMSPMALSITRRFMGLILTAIATEMITGALGVIFPGWMH